MKKIWKQGKISVINYFDNCFEILPFHNLCCLYLNPLFFWMEIPNQNFNSKHHDFKSIILFQFFSWSLIFEIWGFRLFKMQNRKHYLKFEISNLKNIQFYINVQLAHLEAQFFKNLEVLGLPGKLILKTDLKFEFSCLKHIKYNYVLKDKQVSDHTSVELELQFAIDATACCPLKFRRPLALFPSLLRPPSLYLLHYHILSYIFF